jgi:flagellar export protein FliJ
LKRFEFRLARVRDLRKQQMELEEAKLESLMAERAAMEAELARIGSESGEIRAAMLAGGGSLELRAADRYLGRLALERKAQEGRIAEWQQRAVRQRAAVVEARRRLKLLELLEAKRLAEWKAEADREQENLSAELYLARWGK